MDEETRRIGRTDEAHGRRLRRRSGEDVPPGPGDLIRVTPHKGGAWSCSTALHREPFNVELLSLDVGHQVHFWIAMCLEHDVEAVFILPYTKRDFTYL